MNELVHMAKPYYVIRGVVNQSTNAAQFATHEEAVAYAKEMLANDATIPVTLVYECRSQVKRPDPTVHTVLRKV